MKFSIIATGDSLISQRIPQNDPQAIALRNLILSHDIRFTNLEVTINQFEYPASAVSGGTWVAVSPKILDDLKWIGFNLFNAATNHSLDWGYGGLISTMDYLNSADCVYAGIGNNLSEASMPAYIDTPDGRVALISVTSTGKDWHIAGEQRPDVKGRPGVNMLRFETINYLPHDDLTALKRIVDQTDVNARRLQLEQEGFQKPIEGYAVGTNRFMEGPIACTHTYCNKKDLDRIMHYVSEARRQADVVLVSHHVHEFSGNDKANTPDFEYEFAHKCIDAGVDVFIGHGPHILRGIEVYKNHPIFYSLGNFFMQATSITRQPAEFYDKVGLGPQNTPTDGFEAESHNWTTGQSVNPKSYESILPSFTIDNGIVHNVKLIPITLGFKDRISRKGRPRIAFNKEGTQILNHLQILSPDTNIQIQGDIGIITIK